MHKNASGTRGASLMPKKCAFLALLVITLGAERQIPRVCASRLSTPQARFLKPS
ncbi:hypothetical protein Hanom_Chr05g00426481 [Helianthus anomalus]